jgi:hypothetical protein
LDVLTVRDLGLGHLVDGTAIDFTTILIMDEVDILTLLIITQDAGMTVDPDTTRLNMALAVVIMTTTLPDGEGHVITRDRHHRGEEAEDIEMMIAAAAMDAPIHPHVQKKEMMTPLVAEGDVKAIARGLPGLPLSIQKRIDLVVAITPLVVASTPLVADGQVTKRAPCTDSPVVTKAIAHRLTEFPLSMQNRMDLVLAVTPLVADSQVTKRTPCTDSPVVTKAITYRLTEFPLCIQKRIVLILAANAYLVVAITHIASLLLHSLRVLRGHQLSSGLSNQSNRTTNHTADQCSRILENIASFHENDVRRAPLVSFDINYVPLMYLFQQYTTVNHRNTTVDRLL